MAASKVINLSQVSLHKSKKDCWIVVNGMVLDVTKFLDEHPGGDEVILELAGKDVTKEFDDVGHSSAAKKLLSKFQIGVLPGHSSVTTNGETGGEATTLKESKNEQMSATVIKENGSSKLTTVMIDFIVPMLVAGSYFGYSYLAKSTPSSS